MIRAFLLICSLIFAPLASAQQSDLLAALSRAVTASQKLNYSGIFVYQHDGEMETSRITHVVDGGKEFEYLEMLDGSPREVVRTDNEVKCYLPDTHTVIVERLKQKRPFSRLLPASPRGLGDYYKLSKAAPARIAGIETNSIVLEPKDALRYRHQFWIDPKSGLMLKASRYDNKHLALESFAFTKLKIGGRFERETLKVRKKTYGSDWRVQTVASRNDPQENGWQFDEELPGFKQVSVMRRQMSPGVPEGLHYVFSDGLSAISVFIDPLAGRTVSSEGELPPLGAVNVYRRVIGEYQIVVMGEVPPLAVRRFGDGIEQKK